MLILRFCHIIYSWCSGGYYPLPESIHVETLGSGDLGHTCRNTRIWGSRLPRFQGLTSPGQNCGIKMMFWPNFRVFCSFWCRLRELGSHRPKNSHGKNSFRPLDMLSGEQNPAYKTRFPEGGYPASGLIFRDVRAGKSEIRKIPDIRRISGGYPVGGFLIFRPSILLILVSVPVVS